MKKGKPSRAKAKAIPPMKSASGEGFTIEDKIGAICAAALLLGRSPFSHLPGRLIRIDFQVAADHWQSSADDALDPDGDGVTNGDELIANTDPLNRSDRFVMKLHETTGPGSPFRMTIPGKPGRRYSLERSTSLLPLSWSSIGTPSIPVQEEDLVLEDPLPPAPKAFYRARVELP